jgi:serine-type D-Ala-D-Ala endopeptidase (penicillin-binding protein 7)
VPYTWVSRQKVDIAVGKVVDLVGSGWLRFGTGRARPPALFLALFALLAAMPQHAAAQAAAARGERASVKAKASPTERAKAAAPGPRARVVRKAPQRRVAPPRPSVGQLSGLHATDDELDLKSAVALVIDRETDEVLFSKNPNAVLPIASITKLMTALVVVESGQALADGLAVLPEDVRATAGSNSRRRLAPGTLLTRGEMLRLALMASENRAAYALGRSHPGGVGAFVAAMNAKARQLGMNDTRYVEPTGLSSENRSSAQDLARLVRAASEHPIIREYSTSSDATVATGRRQVQFRNTNGLVLNPEWEIEVQKTGYIAAAGRCVVMQAQMAGRQLIMVLLDSAGRYSRIGDAERLRRWLFRAPAPEQAQATTSVPADGAVADAEPAAPRSTETVSLPSVPVPPVLIGTESAMPAAQAR